MSHLIIDDSVKREAALSLCSLKAVAKEMLAGSYSLQGEAAARIFLSFMVCNHQCHRPGT